MTRGITKFLIRDEIPSTDDEMPPSWANICILAFGLSQRILYTVMATGAYNADSCNKDSCF